MKYWPQCSDCSNPEKMMRAIFRKKFDGIVSTYFFHHLDFDQKIDFIQRVTSENLKNRGKLIIADVAFSTLSSLEKKKKEYEHTWDEDEHYPIAEHLLPELTAKGVSVDYSQVSSCAGVFCLGKKH